MYRSNESSMAHLDNLTKKIAKMKEELTELDVNSIQFRNIIEVTHRKLTLKPRKRTEESPLTLLRTSFALTRIVTRNMDRMFL